MPAMGQPCFMVGTETHHPILPLENSMNKARYDGALLTNADTRTQGSQTLFSRSQESVRPKASGDSQNDRFKQRLQSN